MIQFFIKRVDALLMYEMDLHILLPLLQNGHISINFQSTQGQLQKLEKEEELLSVLRRYVVP